LWAYQSIAHGADGVVFFRWRTARFGAEQYWHGLLEHDGRAGRRYNEIKQMGLELKRAGQKILDTEVRSRVAILQSYDARFAFQVQSNSDTFGYENHVYQIYSALWKQGISVDVISSTADLSGYDLVIAPALHILTGELAAHLQEYIQAGGTLVVTPRTGVKDDANVVVNQPLPGLMADVCGVIVTEYDALTHETPQALAFDTGPLAGQTLPVQTWCDILEPQGAQVLARYAHDYYAGEPAITNNRFGKGQAIYLGAFGDSDFYEALFGLLLQEKGVTSPLKVPAGVQVCQRWQGNQSIWFVLNFSGTPQQVDLPGPYRNLLDGTMVSGAIQLPLNGALVLGAMT
jgi:beta-galactosidase